MLRPEGELRVTFTSRLMQMRFEVNCPVWSSQLNLLFVKHPAVLGFFWVPFSSVFSLQHVLYCMVYEVLSKQF